MANTNGIISCDTLAHAIAGSTGSIFAMAVFYPLDTIRFRLQLADNQTKNLNTFETLVNVLKNEGLEALYRGLNPVLVSLATSNFVYFYVFHGLKSLTEESTRADLILGTLAGITNVLLTTPLWVVNSRLKANKQEYTGILDGLRYIAKSEGMHGLWSGVGSSLILVSNPAIQFAVYEALKRYIPSTSAVSFFIMGAVAKAVATVVTYPVQLAQSRQQYGKSKANTLILLYILLRRKGFWALFSGLEAKLCQTVLTAALMFTIYENILSFAFILKNFHLSKFFIQNTKEYVTPYKRV